MSRPNALVCACPMLRSTLGAAPAARARGERLRGLSGDAVPSVPIVPIGPGTHAAGAVAEAGRALQR